jgi:hypothetical protein
MATVNSRKKLKDYIYRRLGAPVIEINVDDAQVEDRIDDAIQFLGEHHYDGVERIYLPYTITQEDYDQRYITISDPNILSIVGMYPVGGESQTSTNNVFGVRYQYTLQDFRNLIDMDLANWAIVQQRLSLIQQMLEPEKQLRWNRTTNRLYIDAEWESDFPVDTGLIFEVYSQVNPANYPDIYDNIFLKRYATALVKMQWGQNLSKYSGIQLPGGVTFDGKAIYEEAKAESEKLESEMRSSFELPPDFIVG